MVLPRSEGESSRPIAPEAWAATLSGAPILDRAITGLVPATVRRWSGINPDIDQCALDRHFVSIHLGGSKRLMRRGEGQTAIREVASGAYSVVPAGAAFQWDTHGPVDFMHVYFEPRMVDGVVERAFDRDPAGVALEENLGEDDPLIRTLAGHLLAELAETDQQQAYLDDLLRLFLCRTLRLHSNARHSNPMARHALAPFRLRRALDFIEANLAQHISVTEIADASGMSRFHFSRAFQRATGKAPYAFLLERRIAAAKTLLLHDGLALADVGACCGFASGSQFSRIFKAEVGMTPSAFRDGR